MKRLFDFGQAKTLCASHTELMDTVQKTIASRDKDGDRIREDAGEVSRSKVIRSVVDMALRSGNSNTQPQPNELSLLRAAYIYDEGQQMKDILNGQEPVRREINKDIIAMDRVRSRLRWFFSGKQKKQAANEAYQRLSGHMQGAYAAVIREQVERNNRLGVISVREAFGAVSGRESEYFHCIPECAPELAEQDTISREIAVHVKKVQVVVDQYQSARQELQRREDKAKADAERALAPLLRAQTMAELRKQDIELLAQKRSGIRIKALRDAGYSTLADVMAANLFKLSVTYGISKETARDIKAVVNEVAQDVAKSVKIRIRSDDRTPENTALLRAIYQYDLIRKVSGAIPGDLKKSLDDAEDHADTLSGLKNNLVWVFSTHAQKKEYANAYQTVVDGLSPLTVRAVQQYARQAQEDHPVTDEQVWQDYIKRSVEYYTILEQLFPDIFGNKDGLYGLPEELAREIQEEVFFPDGLKVELRDYQVLGVKYILHQERVLLGDEMGLGKTLQAIATMVSLRNTGARKFLVVCPASVLPNWCREIDQKSEFHSIKIHGHGRQNAFDGWARGGGVAVTTYETLGTLTMQPRFRFDLLVVDEAHFIKNENALRTQNVRLFGNRTARILYMTGTALENRVDEMLTLLHVLNPEVTEQAKPLSYLSTAPQFRRMIAPVYFRRKREQVLEELPDIETIPAWCDLMPEEQEAYEQTVMRREQHEIRKVSWTTPDLSRSAKACRLKEIVEEAAEDGRKILVFSNYLETIDRVVELFGRHCTRPIRGNISPEKRQQIIEEFENMPAGSVLPAQIIAGGTGLNIQSASVVIICEPQLKPSIENQAISRAYRMGQTRDVLVYRLLATNTIDERIDNMLGEKQRIFNEFADRSVAAEEAAEGIDEKTIGNMIQEEIDRINRRKNGIAE